MNEFPQVAQHRRTQLASSENIYFTLTVQELSNGYRFSGYWWSGCLRLAYG
jgi:hypothetical protein